MKRALIVLALLMGITAITVTSTGCGSGSSTPTKK
jgi:hypothetical protein